MSLAQYFLKKYIAWRFRKRSPFLISLSISGAVLLAVLGLGGLSGAIHYQDVTFQVSQDDSIAFTVLNAVVILASVVFAVSFVMLIIQFILDRAVGSKEKVIVIEGRGLRDDDGTSLAESIGEDFPRVRTPYVLDLRQRMDGILVAPEMLLPKVAAAKEALNQARSGNGRENTQVVYGGLTAVPLTFLTGVELDDEGSISVFDWDRSSEQWRALDDLDDGRRLSEPEIEGVELPESVLLAVSVSYPIEEDDLRTSFNVPILRMELDGRSSNSHWSSEKQSALADQFFETAKKLSECGVRHIHLVLAAPNSVVFNFGRRYDKRNLPEITVYQFERSQPVKYPWGVRMPVGATTVAAIERTSPQ